MDQKQVKLKDKSNEHIQVFVRVRPQNNTETTNKSPTVVDTTIKEIIVNERPTDRITKTFSFDKVFGQDSKQIEVYKAVVAPLIEEVLAGYNCTVFAYGQTGTGKTYTMEGDRSCDPSISWDKDPSSGIIPRTLSHLFDELRVLQAEYTVRVSFLELYNEELFDLLSPADDTSKLKLYEDVNKKGSVIVHGLEEVPVHNKNEVYKIMEKGSMKRQTASTLMNAKSSRSHTIFSITVHIKENSLEGEELLKTGKLNLVDLAGSENVGRSGAVDKRAREAGNINQSLLTLGRCIKSLVERTPHVPYRESKLTRLLQDSLGGKTKTSIIATISPAGCSLEETLSTLDYAHRAKNITNRPEINQKLTKKFLLKEYTEEIDRLRKDLMATREGNGVCIAKENYQEMINQLEDLHTEMAEKIGNIRALTDELEKKEVILADLGMDLDRRTKELSLTNKLLNKSRRRLHDTKTQLRETEQVRDENFHLVEKHLETENVLGKQAHQLLAVAEESTTDTYKLHDKLKRKLEIEDKNSHVANTFLNSFNGKMEKLVTDLEDFAEQQLESYKRSHDACAEHLASGLQSLVEKQNIVSSLEGSLNRFTEVMTTNVARQQNGNKDWLADFLAAQASNCDASCESVDEFMNNIKALLLSFSDDITSTQKLLNEEKASMPLKLASQQEAIQKHYQFQMDGMAELQSSVAQLVQKNMTAIETSRNDSSELKKLREEYVANIQMATQNWLMESSLVSNKIQLDLTQAIADEKKIADTVAESVNKKRESYTTFDSQIAEGVTSLSNNFDTLVTSSSQYLADAQTRVELVTLNLKREQTLRKEGYISEKTRVEKDVHDRMNDLALESENQIQIVEEIISGVQIATAAHEESLQNQKCTLEKYSAKHQGIEINRGDKLSEWSKVACDELQTRKQEVVGFVNNDLSKDIPTGGTPVRKEFRYTSDLAATSPHPRILERFRESRPCILNDSFSESDTNTNDNSSEGDQTLSIEEEIKSLSGLRTSRLRRSLSTSDIPALDSDNILNMSTISEREYKHENKENSSANLCVPPKKPSKTGNLGSVNNTSKSRVDSGLKKPLTAQNRS